MMKLITRYGERFSCPWLLPALEIALGAMGALIGDAAYCGLGVPDAQKLPDGLGSVEPALLAMGV